MASPKVQFLETWCRLTGEPVREARHRVRVLAEAGLLPSYTQPLTTTHLAHALLGFTAPSMHIDAVDDVRQFADLRCHIATTAGSKLLTSPMTSLLDEIVNALNEPAKIILLEVSKTKKAAKLVVNVGGTVRGKGSVSVFEGGETSEYYFSDQTDLTLDSTIYPVVVTRSISYSLISRLLPLVERKNAAPARAAFMRDRQDNSAPVAHTRENRALRPNSQAKPSRNGGPSPKFHRSRGHAYATGQPSPATAGNS